VADDPRDPFAVPPASFARQMAAVAKTGAATSLETALRATGKDRDDVPWIALTFDDGTLDFVTDVFPVLSRLNLQGTLYVSPARVGERGFLGWDAIRMVSRAGIRIGSHGLDHRSLGRMAADEVRSQVVESRRILETRLGVEVTSIAYPYGTIHDFSAMVKEEIRSAGYQSACTSINGINPSSIDPLELRRTKIEQGDDPIFGRILMGGLDGWAFVDRNLASLQNRYA